MFKSLIRLTIHPSVQTRWGEWLRPRDEWRAVRTSGSLSSTDGGYVPGSARTAYAIVTILTVLSAGVGTFSHARDISWRLGTPHNLWEPALWEMTSVTVILALLPLARRGATLVRAGTYPLLVLGLALAALMVVFSALHILGMGLLRELAYGLAGWTYTFPWLREIPYEFRKDLFVYTACVVIFWLVDRANDAAPAKADHTTPDAKDATTKAEFWLRDGSTSLLIDTNEIISVTSAGNYVEYQLTGGRKHLIRTTLQAQEARLASFGFARVHRSRLVNLKRIVSVAWRASGDFEIRLDSGDTITGSRRFKSAVTSFAN
jgi:hypothetical protein